ncbi:MAG TPA: Hpt domain-containing protein, partial [Phycisphaerae bacterium]|nr:Hpt domain-containing protein [Phycisphaerae bacterium]
MSFEKIDFDPEAALEQFEGDMELLLDVTEMYLDCQAEMMQAVEEAVEACDLEKLNRAAHSLKGTLGQLSAQAAQEAAFRLETMGRQGQQAQLAEAWQDMQDKNNRLCEALRTFHRG